MSESSAIDMLEVYPAPEDMNETQRGLWDAFRQVSKSCGLALAFNAYKAVFKVCKIVVEGVGEEDEEKEVVTGDTWISATHFPNDMSIDVQWNLPGHSPSTDPLDTLSLHMIENVGTEVESEPVERYISSDYNRSGSSKGKITFVLHNEVENDPGVDFVVRYKHGNNNVEIARTNLTTISREQEKWSLNGKLEVELQPEQQRLLLRFDLREVLDFTPHSSDKLVVTEVLSRHLNSVISTPATLELSGTTYINFNLELENGLNYNVRYLHLDKAIAISDSFTCSCLCEVSSGDECAMTAEFDPDTCSVLMTWAFLPNSVVKTKQSQQICLYAQSCAQDQLCTDGGSSEAQIDCELDLQSHLHGISVPSSGRRRGSATITLKGAVQNGKTYVLHYTEHTRNKWVTYGSIAFNVQGVSEENLNLDRLIESHIANAQVCLQYMVHQAQEVNLADANPLLDVEIDRDFSLLQFTKDFNKTPNTKSTDAMVSMRTDAFHAIDSNELLGGLMDHIKAGESLVIYAGAGCSMAAPACSPAWWRLLADLLTCTFACAPSQHLFPKNVSNTDITRQPEEIMESFHFILGDDLLTLFRMLEEGRPNANHIAIAKLAKVGKVKAIFTTNFDIFIERALQDEGVEFRVVVTQDEFEQYHRKCCNDEGVANDGAIVTVMKIHGSLERPETIVAVANHYKSGKGFSDSKAKVLAKIVEKCPVLFAGYSGWDFMHSNYQSFWASVGVSGCRGLYWLTLKGASGGPVLGEVVGAHVGSKLQVGAGALPDFLLDVLESCAPGEGLAMAQWSSRIDDAKESFNVRQAQDCFMRQWVSAVPPPTLLSLVLIEAERLGAAQQKYAVKSRSVRPVAESFESSTDVQAVYMQIAMDFQSGKISQDEYHRQIAVQTIRTTFQHLVVENAKKDLLAQMCLNMQNHHPLFVNDPTFKSLLPGMLLSISMGLPGDADVEEYMSMALAYVTKLNRYKSSLGERNKIMYETYLYCSIMLSGTDDQQQQIDEWVNIFADVCIKEKLSDDAITAERTALLKRITGLCNGRVDTQRVLQNQIELWLQIPDTSISEILQCGLTIALALIHQCDSRAEMFSSLPGFMSKVIIPLSTPDFDELPFFVFQEFENKFNEVLVPILTRITEIRDSFPPLPPSFQRGPTPDEVLAAFDISSLLMWYPACKNIGHSYQIAEQLAFKGFYPKEQLPSCICKYLIPRAQDALQRCSGGGIVSDSRLVQPLLSLIAKLGESVGDFTLIEQATKASLALTEGKVTELTPAPIPEALACACQERGDFEAARHWYSLALDGVKTCIIRQKTDAIVLNACLVAAKCGDKRQALKWAFACSPQFAGISSRLATTGPARCILAQQVLAWSHELGFSSAKAASEALMRA